MIKKALSGTFTLVWGLGMRLRADWNLVDYITTAMYNGCHLTEFRFIFKLNVLHLPLPKQKPQPPAPKRPFKNDYVDSLHMKLATTGMGHGAPQQGETWVMEVGCRAFKYKLFIDVLRCLPSPFLPPFLLPSPPIALSNYCGGVSS